MTTREKIFAALALATIAIGITAYAWPAASQNQPSLQELEQTALSQPDAGKRTAAAAALSSRGRSAIPHIQRVLQLSPEPEVHAVCIQSLGELYDFSSMEKLLDLLESPTPTTRNRAAAAIARMTGIHTEFDSADPEKRRQIIALYREQWASLKNSQTLTDFQQHINANLNTIGAKP